MTMYVETVFAITESANVWMQHIQYMNMCTTFSQDGMGIAMYHLSSIFIVKSTVMILIKIYLIF